MPRCMMVLHHCWLLHCRAMCRLCGSSKSLSFFGWDSTRLMACSTEISFKQVQKQKHRTAIWSIRHPYRKRKIQWEIFNVVLFSGVSICCWSFSCCDFTSLVVVQLWLFGLGAKATLDTSQSGYTQDHQGEMQGRRNDDVQGCPTNPCGAINSIGTVRNTWYYIHHVPLTICYRMLLMLLECYYITWLAAGDLRCFLDP